MTFEKIKGTLGFGCMRLPMDGEQVDKAHFNRMIDAFMQAGFNYFDTAHGYIGGKSETAIRDCLSSRYNREEFVLANKLSGWMFEKQEDVIPLFESQLELCGVEYFDFYLFHSMNKGLYEKHKRCNTFETVKRFKEQGKIRHIALSFHDTADVLDTILKEQPEIEAVQLQFNYLDYDDPTVQSKECYDIAIKHGKKIMIMEPVKGGTLVNLPEEAKQALEEFGDGSTASVALRFAASFPDVFMVLSGMGNCEMMADNIKTFKNFVPIKEQDIDAFDKVRRLIRKANQIPCTGCNYCTEVCPSKIAIPEIFAEYNRFMRAEISRDESKQLLAPYRESIDSCIGCGACEGNCPQSIKIREMLEKV